MYVKSETDNNEGNEDENGHGGGNKYKDGNSGGGVDGNGNGEEEEYDNEGRNREGSSGGVDGDGNGEEDNNNNNEGRSVEGSSGAKKRQAPHDNKPAAATRLKKKKIDDSMDHQMATQSTKKAALKGKCYDFELLSDNRLYSCSVLGKLSIVYSRWTWF